jgi:hypothetical protein
MTLLEFITELEISRLKGMNDGSLTSRIPTWITAGDGRQYLHELHEKLPKLLKMVKVLSEACERIEDYNPSACPGVARQALAECEKILMEEK